MTNKAIAIGIGNIKQHGGFQDLDEALILMDKATKKAIKDSSENITNFIDEIRIPKGFWEYTNPGRWIADNNRISTEESIIDQYCIAVMQYKLQFYWIFHLCQLGHLLEPNLVLKRLYY